MWTHVSRCSFWYHLRFGFIGVVSYDDPVPALTIPADQPNVVIGVDLGVKLPCFVDPDVNIEKPCSTLATVDSQERLVPTVASELIFGTGSHVYPI